MKFVNGARFQKGYMYRIGIKIHLRKKAPLFHLEEEGFQKQNNLILVAIGLCKPSYKLILITLLV